MLDFPDPVALPSRRRFLAASAALAAAPLLARRALAARINPPALLENLEGGYRVLPAGGVFCGGVTPLGRSRDRARPGRAPGSRSRTPGASSRRICKGLAARSRPCAAWSCASPSSSPSKRSAPSISPTAEQLTKWKLVLGPYSAVCRTNVVPAKDAPAEPVVHAFSYCVPSDYSGTTFCVSGTADIDARGQIVAAGDVSPAGMKLRLQHCVDVITERLAMLDLTWSEATHIDLCVAQDIPGLMAAVVVPGLQGAAARGIRVHFARPPIVGTESRAGVPGMPARAGRVGMKRPRGQRNVNCLHFATTSRQRVGRIVTVTKAPLTRRDHGDYSELHQRPGAAANARRRPSL